jgi:hypothetical protein
VAISGAGYYSINTQQGTLTGDLLENSQPPPSEPRLHGLRSVHAIAGGAHTVGLRGIAYRLDDLSHWTRIDDGLPASFNAQAIHGFARNDIYAVGREGESWHFDEQNWTPIELPTSATLTSVKCAPNGVVYIAGDQGVLIAGRGAAWSVIDHGETKGDIWDLEWFEDSLYVSTMAAVFRLKGSTLEKVNFGADPPKTCYQLSTAPGVMWSNGERDLMSFDGKSWTRIV